MSNRYRPLSAAQLQKLEKALFIKYTYESNRIEGSTLTLQKTASVVNKGITVSGKSLREHLEVINHYEVSIHPFIDGNGRTARLIMNMILLQHGYTIVNITGDNESRVNYYNALEKCQTENRCEEFITLADCRAYIYYFIPQYCKNR